MCRWTCADQVPILLAYGTLTMSSAEMSRSGAVEVHCQAEDQDTQWSKYRANASHAIGVASWLARIRVCPRHIAVSPVMIHSCHAVLS